MNWDDLKYFLALARERTFTGAGKVLGVKHTTVARRIAALEGDLGSRLFDQLPEGYAMTQAAENLYAHALVMEEQAQTIGREVFGMDTQLEGPLRLTAPHDVLNCLVLPKLHRFTDAYPGIDIKIFGSAGLMDLAARQADIALRLTPNPPEYLIGKKILPLRHGVYASEKYIRTKRKNDSVILWENEQGVPEWVEKHFPNARVCLRTDEITTMLGAVKNHLGLARMPCFGADSEPSLRRIDLQLTPSNWGVWVLCHIDLRSTARIRVCKEFLIDIIEEQRELIEGLTSQYMR